MLNLVLKDILILKKDSKDMFLGAILIFLCVCIFQFFWPECVYICIPLLCAISFILSSYGFGEKNDIDILINSLPVNRKEVVFSKYISAFVFLIISLVITAVLSTIVKLSGFSHINRLINLQDVLICFVFIAVYSSIYLPVYLWLGYFKSQTINNILNFCAVIILICIIMIAVNINNGTAAEWIMKIVSAAGFKLKLFTVCIFSSMLLMLTSILISLKIYLNRDL